MSAPLAPTRASGETSCIIFYQLCNIVKLRQILTATMQNVTVPFLDITVNHDACLYKNKNILTWFWLPYAAADLTWNLANIPYSC